MNENNASRFQFGNSDELHETILAEDLKDSKIDKLSNRVTLLTILIPLMAGIILFFAYHDIKKRVSQIHDSKGAYIDKIKNDLEEEIAFMSEEQAKIKDIHSKNIPLLEKSIAFLSSELKSTQLLLSNLESTSISREDMSQTVKSLNAENRTVSDNMMVEIETLKDVENQITQDIGEISNKLYAFADMLNEMKANVNKLNTDISSLSEEKIGKKELDLAIKLEEMSSRQELLEFKATLNKKIDSLKNKTNSVKSIQSQTVAVQTIKGSKQSKEQATSSSPSTTSGIEEQDID